MDADRKTRTEARVICYPNSSSVISHLCTREARLAAERNLQHDGPCQPVMCAVLATQSKHLDSQTQR